MNPSADAVTLPSTAPVASVTVQPVGEVVTVVLVTCLVLDPAA